MPESKWTREAAAGAVWLSSRLKMEPGTAFCAAAWLVFASALAWKLRRSGASEVCAAAAAVASLYWVVPPVVHGLLLLGYSSILVWVTNTRSELLPVKDRAVLVTGNTHTHPTCLCSCASSCGTKVIPRRVRGAWTGFRFQRSSLLSSQTFALLTPCLTCAQVAILASGTSWRGASVRWARWCLPACWMLTALALGS